MPQAFFTRLPLPDYRRRTELYHEAAAPAGPRRGTNGTRDALATACSVARKSRAKTVWETQYTLHTRCSRRLGDWADMHTAHHVMFSTWQEATVKRRSLR